MARRAPASSWSSSHVLAGLLGLLLLSAFAILFAMTPITHDMDTAAVDQPRQAVRAESAPSPLDSVVVVGQSETASLLVPREEVDQLAARIADRLAHRALKPIAFDQASLGARADDSPAQPAAWLGDAVGRQELPRARFKSQEGLEELGGRQSEEVAAYDPKVPTKPLNELVIGLTGGIAAGKSTVGKWLVDKLGATLIDCDVLGHQAYEPGTPCHAAVAAAFGSDVVSASDGRIDRRVLGSKVFGNAAEMKKLTDIVWPVVADMAAERIQRWRADPARTGPCVLEAAVLIEAGWQSLVDQIWVVVAEPELAVARLVARNNLDETAARSRLASQLSNAERCAHAHVVVENNSSVDDLERTLVAITSRS